MPNHRFSYFLLLPLLFFTFLACEEPDPHNGRVPLASVGDTFLYKDEVNLLYATHSHGDDSVAFVKNYVDRWVVEMMFYNKACRNVAATENIDRMVENYRRNLILNLYQDALISQQLVPNISQAEIDSFYNGNVSLFEVEEALFRGFFVKLPERTRGMNEVRKWCVVQSPDDLESLEQFCVTNSAECGFFMEEWCLLGHLAQRLPLTETDLEQRLSANSVVEFKDNGFTYFVCADTLLVEGDRKPLELVYNDVRDLLVNSKKPQFIKDVKGTLYQEALQNGQIKLYY